MWGLLNFDVFPLCIREQMFKKFIGKVMHMWAPGIVDVLEHIYG